MVARIVIDTSSGERVTAMVFNELIGTIIDDESGCSVIEKLLVAPAKKYTVSANGIVKGVERFVTSASPELFSDSGDDVGNEKSPIYIKDDGYETPLGE